MPLYEYVCDTDGEVIELLRPISEADHPVPDPKGLGRTFRRRHSTFAAKSTSTTSSTPLPTTCCPCGKPTSACPSSRS